MLTNLDSPPAEPCSAQQLAARLPRRYLAVLALVAALLILDQAVLQPLLLQVSLYAPTINVAGRQRMLSQRLTKAALIMQSLSDGRDEEAFRASQRELQQSLEQWTRAHQVLLDGDQALGLPPTDDPDVQMEFSNLEPHFQKMRLAADVLQGLHPPTTADDQVRVDGQVAAILQNERAYLPMMDRIVGLYEHEARRQVLVLRLFGLAVVTAVILLMIALAYLVLRPASRLILEQVQQLELRVQHRTAELTRINQALQSEMHERQQAEQRTGELSSQLAHASRVTALGQLASGLAHEINQPLAAINNYAETCGLLLDQQPTKLQEARHAVQHIGRAALRAGEIVRRMRNFVRPSTPGAECMVQHVRVNDLVSEVAALCRAELSGSQIRLNLDLAEELPEIEIDPIRIQQVLVNLVQNAIQALQHSPRDPRRLTIRTSLLQAMIQVEVHDNGPGFNCQPQSIFAPFFTTRPDGLGMGLAISRDIIQERQGDLWAERNPRGGAIVRFTLPASGNDGDCVQQDAHCLCR